MGNFKSSPQIGIPVKSPFMELKAPEFDAVVKPVFNYLCSNCRKAGLQDCEHNKNIIINKYDENVGFLVHCFDCGKLTPRNCSHCVRCDKCVYSSYKHCDKCNTCNPSEYIHIDKLNRCVDGNCYTSDGTRKAC